MGWLGLWPRVMNAARERLALRFMHGLSRGGACPKNISTQILDIAGHDQAQFAAFRSDSVPCWQRPMFLRYSVSKDA